MTTPSTLSASFTNMSLSPIEGPQQSSTPDRTPGTAPSDLTSSSGMRSPMRLMTLDEYWTGRQPTPPPVHSEAVTVAPRPRRRRNNASRRRRRAARDNSGRAVRPSPPGTDSLENDESSRTWPEWPTSTYARLPEGVTCLDLAAQGLLVRVQLTYWALESYLRGASRRELSSVKYRLVRCVEECNACLRTLIGHFASRLSSTSATLGEYYGYFTALGDLTGEWPYEHNHHLANYIMERNMACRILFGTPGFLQYYASLIDTQPFRRLRASFTRRSNVLH